MEKTNFGECRIRGEMSYRIIKNYARLEAKDYRADHVFKMSQSGWPGDWEGRTILALILLWEITGREPAFLRDILNKINSNLNEKGYLGEVLPAGMANEQQLSGHNWLLRGLLELYQLQKDNEVKYLIRNIFENVYLPLLDPDLYDSYPLERDVRCFDGAADGHLQENIVNGWKLSTDIGCSFISIDGLSQYYQLFRDERALRLLKNMVKRFQCIDFCQASMQTHASLTATRGIVRLYETTKEPELLEFAISFFDIYLEHGMTENYANYNWFGRPNWTEPCGIVDAYLLASELFRITHDSMYLETANKTLYSALMHAQRENGGFGCDSCLTPDHRELAAYSPEYYEAYWCCSMRGAEGLANAVRYSVLQDNDVFFFTNFLSADYCFAQASFQIDSQFPQSGEVDINVSSCKKPISLCFFIPKEIANDISVLKNGVWISLDFQNNFYCLKIEAPCKIQLRFDIPLQVITLKHDASAVALWQGYIMQGTRQNDCLCAVNDSIYRSREELIATPTKLIFDQLEGMRFKGVK